MAELRQLFNPIDPAPLRERDLDPRIEAFIIEWGREAPRGTWLSLVVRLDSATGLPDDAGVLDAAIHQFFAARARSSRQQLRRLFSTGRISLAIGLAVLGVLSILGQLIGTATHGSGAGLMLRESLTIGGWVAMWRPLQIFLYEWWPIRADARLFDRLAAMPVTISGPANHGSVSSPPPPRAG